MQFLSRFTFNSTGLLRLRCLSDGARQMVAEELTVGNTGQLVSQLSLPLGAANWNSLGKEFMGHMQNSMHNSVIPKLKQH